MIRQRYDRWAGAIGLALLLAAPAIAVWFLRRSPRLDLLFQSASFHIVVVSAIAACALGVAILAMAAAANTGQPRVVLLALGCAIVGLFMLGHGLTTPGFAGRPINQWIGRFPLLAIAGFAGCLITATRGRGVVLRLAGSHPMATLILPTLGLAVACGVVVANPSAGFGSRPLPFENGIRLALLAASAVALAVAGYTHWRRWRLGRDRIELALVVASWLSVDAIVSFRFGQLWRLSWWDYHVYLLVGFGAAVYAVVTSYGRTRSAEEALGSIAVIDPLVLVARGQPEAMQALVGAVEAKDPYTHGHSARVAELSVRLGLHLGIGLPGSPVGPWRTCSQDEEHTSILAVSTPSLLSWPRTGCVQSKRGNTKFSSMRQKPATEASSYRAPAKQREAPRTSKVCTQR